MLQRWSQNVHTNLKYLESKSKIINTETEMCIYDAFIEANCPFIWMYRNATNTKHIENVQKPALRMYFNDYLLVMSIGVKTKELHVRNIRHL